MNEKLCRSLNVEVRVVSETDGTIDYVASDETIDSYGEIIRADGWRFSQFRKNAPFVDSHYYGSIATVLGKVIDFRVEGRRLVERVQWAKDQPGTLAEWGWKMTVGGFLRAVSVGFYAVRYITRFTDDQAGWAAQLKDLGIDPKDPAKQPRTIYLEHEQIELSAVVLGANPNALTLARAYKAGCLSEGDLDKISATYAARRTPAPASEAHGPASASDATKRAARIAFMAEIQRHL